MLKYITVERRYIFTIICDGCGEETKIIGEDDDPTKLLGLAGWQADEYEAEQFCPKCQKALSIAGMKR